MEAIQYKHNWSSSLSDEDERVRKFGTLLFEADTSESYEVESAHLYRGTDGRFNLLEANGCSCWDGDYDGWSFTKLQLLKWAKSKKHSQELESRRQAYELVADWITSNPELLEATS